MRRICVAIALPILFAACESAEHVDPKLEESVGWYTGVAGSVDNPRAKELLLQAAEDDDTISRMWIARVHSRGRMNFEENPRLAREIADDIIDRVEELAGESVPEAIFLMGTAYDEGLGRDENAETAIQWYRRAAEYGHGLARHNLGNAYFAGRGVPQSDSLAVYWWTLAGENGDAIPQLRLGTMYEQGRGVGQDLAEAKRWYQRAAERGNDEARAAVERMEGAR